MRLWFRVAYLHDEFAVVLATEQHADRPGRLMQPIQNVQALVKSSLAVARSEPRSGFLIPVVIAEHLKALHMTAPRQNLTEIADAIMRIGGDLGNAAA